MLNHMDKEAVTPLRAAPIPKHVSPVAALAARMDSVRSYLSDCIGRRTLGSELGSSYSPSPLGFSSHSDDGASRDNADDTYPDDTVEFDISHVSGDTEMQIRKQPRRPREVSPADTFAMRSSLSRSRGSNTNEEAGGGSADTTQSSLWPLLSASAYVEPIGSDADEFSSEGAEAGKAAAAVAAPLSTSRISGPVADSPSPTPNLLVPGGDPWDEYSDRATPSPRTCALRPLLLCSKQAVHARSSSLVYIRSSANHNRMASGNSVPHPSVLTHRRNLSLSQRSQRFQRGAIPSSPVTIPGRIMHDIFCLFLIVLDYIEWALILAYRLVSDIRAGPSAALSRRRAPGRRFYF
jgi:hypothetical protein